MLSKNSKFRKLFAEDLFDEEMNVRVQDKDQGCEVPISEVRMEEFFNSLDPLIEPRGPCTGDIQEKGNEGTTELQKPKNLS